MQHHKMANSPIIAAIVLGTLLFTVWIVVLIIMLSTNKQKLPKFVISPLPIPTPIPIPCSDLILPPRPDFSLLPSGVLTIQSVGSAPSTITLFRGGYVDVIVASSSGNDVALLVPASPQNEAGTTIRVSNTGLSGNIVFTPSQGVSLNACSNPCVAPTTSGYFTAVAANSYVRN